MLSRTPWVIAGLSIVVIGTLAALMLWKGTDTPTQPLVVYCAAAFREPMEEIKQIYESQKGVKIEVNYEESSSILTKLKTSKQADVFLPADESYITEAGELLSDSFPLASMNAAVVVNKAANSSLATWDDLIKEGSQVAIGSEAAAITRLTKNKLGEARWKQLKDRAVEKGMVTNVALAVKVDRNLTAGIIWDSMLSSPKFDDLQAVKIPELEGITATVKVGVVKSSTRPIDAQAFAKFIAISCPDILKKHGFTVISAPIKQDSAERPEIVLFAGSMLRPAIEETIVEFEKKEGVKIIRTYNGCGILVSQMKVLKDKPDAQFPDLYFSCDPTFMNQVSDLFEKPKTISKNQLVIAVPKGNKHAIKSLKDLGQEGLRIGVGHEQQCALGAITEGVLIRSKVYKSVQENIQVRSPSGDLLVNQLRTGSLDAVIAYISNVKPFEDMLDAILVQEGGCEPLQPIAISKTTAHPEVVKRLIQAIESAESKSRFEKLGFGWELKK